MNFKSFPLAILLFLFRGLRFDPATSYLPANPAYSILHVVQPDPDDYLGDDLEHGLLPILLQRLPLGEQLKDLPPQERFHDYPGMLRGQYHIGRPDVDSLGDAWQVHDQGGEVREEGDGDVPGVLRLMLREYVLKVAHADH